MVRRLCILFFCWLPLISFSQEIEGTWWGSVNKAYQNLTKPTLKLELTLGNDSVITGTITQLVAGNRFHQYAVSGNIKDGLIYLHEDSGIARNVPEYRPLREYRMEFITRRGEVLLEGISTTKVNRAMVSSRVSVLFAQEGEEQPEERPVITSLPATLKFTYAKIHIPVWQLKANVIQLPPAEKLREQPMVVVIPGRLKPKPIQDIEVAVVRLPGTPLNIPVQEKEREIPLPALTLTMPQPLQFRTPQVKVVVARAATVTLTTPVQEKEREIHLPVLTLTMPQPALFKIPQIKAVAVQTIPNTLIPLAVEKEREIYLPPLSLTLPQPLPFRISRIKITLAHTEPVALIALKKEKEREIILPPLVVNNPRPLKLPQQDKIAVLPMKAAPATLIIPPDATRPTPPVKETRSQKIVKTIEIASGTAVKIELTDNARIDNDIISVYVNGEKVVDKQVLSYTPIVVNIKPVSETDVSVFAESYGSMPPCTATMKVITEQQTYSVDLSSDFKTNGTIRIVVNK